MGTSRGLPIQLQNRSGGSVDQLAAQVQQFLAEAAKRPELGRLSTTFEPGTPQVSVELDREKARTLGVKVDSVLRDATGLLERALCERHRPLRPRVQSFPPG